MLQNIVLQKVVKFFEIGDNFFQLVIPALFKHFPFSGLKPVLVYPVGDLFAIIILAVQPAAVYSQASDDPPRLPTCEEVLKEIEQYTQAIKINPKDERAYYYRSGAYMYIGEYGKVITDSNELIKMNPGEINYYYARGTAYLYNDNYNSAVADFSTVLRMDPNFYYFQNEVLDLLSSHSVELAVRQGAKMIRIEAGSFMMGSPDNEPERIGNEGPRHRVNISAFYMSKFQVTQKEYQEVMGTNPSSFKGDNNPEVSE